MRIVSLTVSDLRLFERLELAPGPGLNLITGANGAGKTTILEAIYLAGRGRSFRHSDAGPMIRNGAHDATVVVSLADEQGGRRSVLGVKREKKVLSCRLDGQDVRRRSALAEALPVQWIGSQPQLLLGMGPEVRRRFIDMGLFHVEHGYLDAYVEFQRILRQRNAAIRNGNPEGVRIWNQPMDAAATRLTESRDRFVQALEPRVRELLERWGAGFSVRFRFRPGWPADRPLVQQLREKIELDLRMGYTTVGPQRAEFEILTDKTLAERTLSRGQQKLLVFALNFALLDVIREAGRVNPILLVDDLAAELDEGNRRLMMQEIVNRESQAFVTAIEPGSFTPLPPGSLMFHVEHGRLAGGT